MNPAERKVEVSLEQKPKVQASFVAIQPQTGEVKAMVGGYDFDESKFNRATQAMRQTGSSFKPFVYAAAVDNGLRPDDTIVDAPVSFGAYSPGNYDGKFKGTIPIRQAFAESRNIPAVKTLAKLGVQNLIPYVRRFGITSRIEPVLPIALGAADVTLIEMVSAYSTFPNDGVRVVQGEQPDHADPRQRRDRAGRPRRPRDGHARVSRFRDPHRIEDGRVTTVRTEVNSNLIVAAALTSVIMLVGFVHAPLMPVVAGAAIACGWTLWRTSGN